jgi:phosphopantothenoylcysteine decarboxylase/phosphopantothenate--cysteine ligase
MGVAIAEAAWRRGAEVVLVAGPLSTDAPVGPRIVNVETTGDMLNAVRRELAGTDILVMAAAPADFRASSVATSKVKKASAPESIALESTPDILRETIADRPRGMIAVGFALETDDVLKHGASKLASKELDLIVTNDAREPGAGFSVDTNRVTLLSRNGTRTDLPMMPKTEVADAILDRVVELLNGR